MPMRIFLFVFFVFMSLVVSFAVDDASMIEVTNGANQFIVTSTADQSESGLLSLREAIEQANSVNSNEIIFENTVFSTPQTITLQ